MEEIFDDLLAYFLSCTYSFTFIVVPIILQAIKQESWKEENPSCF